MPAIGKVSSRRSPRQSTEADLQTERQCDGGARAAARAGAGGLSRVLVRQVEHGARPSGMHSSSGDDLIRGAFNGFATMTGPFLFFLMQADRRGVEAGREEARSVSNTLTRLAAIAGPRPRWRSLGGGRHVSQPDLAPDPRRGRGDPRRGDRDRPGRAQPAPAGAQPRRTRPARRRLQPDDRAAAARRAARHVRDQAALETTIADRTADLRAANDKLSSEIDRSRRRFFADVSHELRTPLTVILGECEIAMTPRGRLVEPAQRAADCDHDRVADHDAFAVIRRRARRLQRRVEDMLRVARSESGTIELHFKPRSRCRRSAPARSRPSRAPPSARTWRSGWRTVGRRCRRRRRFRMAAPDCRRHDRQRPALRDGRERHRAGLRDERGRGATPRRSRRRAGIRRRGSAELLVRFARRAGRRGTIEDVSGHGIGLVIW